MKDTAEESDVIFNSPKESPASKVPTSIAKNKSDINNLSKFTIKTDQKIEVKHIDLNREEDSSVLFKESL